MTVPIPWLHIGMGALMALLSIPLVMGLVPRNHFYGIRTRKAFASRANWYAINAYGGRLFLVFGLFLTAFGLLTLTVAPAPTSPWAPVFMAVPFIPLIPVILRINAFGRTLPDA